jgi:hypothetical protein
MANDLVRLNPHIDQMRQLLSQTAETERALVQSLSDALTRFDADTLRNVRNMAAEHEARRAGILNELQALAASIGTFQPGRETVEPAAIQRQAGPKLSYHDELEASLHALLTEGSHA